jgi:tetratricopeptide (TPR) repeat protein
MGFPSVYQIALKVLVSGLLAWIIVLCAWGLYRIWGRSELVYRNFTYTRDGANDATAGLHFTQLVNHEIRQLHRLLSPPKGTDDSFIIPTVNQQGGRVEAVDLPRLPEALLPAIDIRAYGIQFSALANRLFQQVIPPNEIVGTVAENKGRFDVYVELHQIGTRAEEIIPAALATEHTAKDAAAFATACRVYRMLGAQRKMIYAEASDAEFEVFARALRQYQLYRSSLAEVRPPTITEESLKETERLLGGLMERNSRFPPIYKLAALVAYSKGQIEDAIAHLEKYAALWPADVVEDTNAQDLLAQYKEEVQQVQEAAATSQIVGFNPKTRQRPVRPGISVSSTETTAGTICCIVTNAGAPSDDLYLLGPDFLLGTVAGTKVVQPGLVDGGVPETDIIAKVTRGVSGVGTVARLTVNSETATSDFSFAGTARAQVGQAVRKVGRTTGVTLGTVIDTNFTTQIPYGDGIRTFSGLIAIRSGNNSPFSLGGDAGAPVVDEQDRLIGMHFAGSKDLSLVLPIDYIFQELGVKLVQ